MSPGVMQGSEHIFTGPDTFPYCGLVELATERQKSKTDQYFVSGGFPKEVFHQIQGPKPMT